MACCGKRVPLSAGTVERLWAESGGHCQNPSCRYGRYDLLAPVKRKHIAEMAHLIPASPSGPRASENKELDDRDRARPENIAVLCPTCHTVVDKAPEEYPASRMQEWKKRSQDGRAFAHGTPDYATRPQAREHVERLLGKNKAVFDRYSPIDGEFDVTRADQWRRHVADTIIPNNRELLRVLQANRGLLTTREASTVDLFELHAQELEERHHDDDWTPGSTQFPVDMTTILGD
jgi:hypothetical protein